MPVVAAALIIVATTLLWWGASRREEDRISAMVAAEADRTATHVQSHLDALVEGLERTALRWSGAESLSEQGASVESTLLLRDPAFSSILWLDEDLQLLWAMGPDASPVPGQVEQWLESTESSGRQRALDRQRIVISRALPGPGGVRSFLVNVPLIVGPGASGVMIAVIDLEEWGTRVAMNLASPMEMQITPVGLDVKASTSPFRARWAQHRDISRGSLQLHLAVWPTEATLATLRSPLPRTVLVSGLAFALLLGLGMRLGQVEGLRTRDARMAAALQREVEARRRAENQLAARARELERSNNALLQFARVISHDLRDPLNVIDMHLQLLAKAPADTDKVDRHKRKARGAIKHMVRMIDGLLSYSRLGGAETTEPVDTEEALDKARAHLESAITEANAEITAENLPRVSGHFDQFVQLLQNLIGNAIHHHGDGEPRIRVACEAKGKHWLFRVADNGPGIPPDEVDGIFDLFRSAGESGGTGVGLATCRRVVESRGGRIWARSSPTEGTTFYFTWPREQSDAAS